MYKNTICLRGRSGPLCVFVFPVDLQQMIYRLVIRKVSALSMRYQLFSCSLFFCLISLRQSSECQICEGGHYYYWCSDCVLFLPFANDAFDVVIRLAMR